MKVLLSAYACEPGKGSEPEVGLQAVLAAASSHEVWVLTRENNIPSLSAYFASHPLRQRIHLEGLEAPGTAMRAKRLVPGGLHWYYDTWQRRTAIRACELHTTVRFDLVHHVTFATYWTRAGVSSVDVPMVWGPVGGGVNPPLSLLPLLGLKGTATGLARSVLRPLVSRFLAIPRRRPRTVVLAQNPETEHRLRSHEDLSVLPNATATSVDVEGSTSVRRQDVSFVGRLVAWKGGSLAVRSLSHLNDDEAVLNIFGDGPDRRRMERITEALGLTKRVVFHGRLPRRQLLETIRTTGALLHVALHDESPLVVAEALALGTPVVCLDHGGPAELVRWWPNSPSASVPPGLPEETAEELARSLGAFLNDPPPVATFPRTPIKSFRAELLKAYDACSAT